MSKLKMEYNKHLTRWYKAFTYLDGPPTEERLKWVDEYKHIGDQLNALVVLMGEHCIWVTNKELREGFHVPTTL